MLEWRPMQGHDGQSASKQEREAFCRTLCLDQPTGWASPDEWARVCYRMFAFLIRRRLPYIHLDEQLRWYDREMDMSLRESRRMLQDHCGSRMRGRCFFVTDEGLMGMGTGFMDPDDVVCVPLGCSTPVLLRPDGKGQFQYVGDDYVDGYMYGRAIDHLQSGRKEIREFIIR